MTSAMRCQMMSTMANTVDSRSSCCGNDIQQPPRRHGMQLDSSGMRRASKREANRAQHRLLSICHDVKVLSRTIQQIIADHHGGTSSFEEVKKVPISSWPVISNERCGLVSVRWFQGYCFIWMLLNAIWFFCSFFD